MRQESKPRKWRVRRKASISRVKKTNSCFRRDEETKLRCLNLTLTEPIP
jgi:hypothetical protein